MADNQQPENATETAIRAELAPLLPWNWTLKFEQGGCSDAFTNFTLSGKDDSETLVWCDEEYDAAKDNTDTYEEDGEEPYPIPKEGIGYYCPHSEWEWSYIGATADDVQLWLMLKYHDIRFWRPELVGHHMRETELVNSVNKKYRDDDASYYEVNDDGTMTGGMVGVDGDNCLIVEWDESKKRLVGEGNGGFFAVFERSVSHNFWAVLKYEETGEDKPNDYDEWNDDPFSERPSPNRTPN